MTRHERKLKATLVAALAVQTIGGVDPFGTGRHLPTPRLYAAVAIVWGSLGLAAQGGGRAGEAAANLSVLVLLTMAVLGPFGRTAVSFLEDTAAFFSSEVVQPVDYGDAEPGGGELTA